MTYKGLEDKLVQFFYEYERNRGYGNFKNSSTSVLPGWVLKQHIVFKCNGKTVFDNFDDSEHRIPLSVQYAILRYGLPERPKKYNKKNLLIVYNIKSEMISIG